MIRALFSFPIFAGCVLPEVGELVEIEDQEGLLQEYLPEECTTGFYFDMEEETLGLKIVFRYGARTFTPTDRPSEKNTLFLKSESAEENLAVSVPFMNWHPANSLRFTMPSMA